MQQLASSHSLADFVSRLEKKDVSLFTILIRISQKFFINKYNEQGDRSNIFVTSLPKIANIISK